MSGRATTLAQDDIGPDDLVRLDVAAALAFKNGAIKLSALRREAARGRLTVWRIANKDMTTLTEVRRMVERCLRNPGWPDSGSVPQTANDPPPGSFSIVDVKSAQAAAQLREKAEGKLTEYLAAKHDAAPRANRRPDQTPVADVLSVYLDNVVPRQGRPGKVARRIERLIAWWGDKLLSQVDAARCAAYVKQTSKGGARRDLEDLRAAINYHAKRGLHYRAYRGRASGEGKAAVEIPDEGRGCPAAMGLLAPYARRGAPTWRSQGPTGCERELLRSTSPGSIHPYGRLYRLADDADPARASIKAASGRAFIDLDANLYYRLPEDVEEATNKRSPTSRLGTSIAAHIRRWRDKGAIAQFVVEWNGHPIKSVKTAWKRAVALAGITGNPTPHTLRHTAVTWLKQAGLPASTSPASRVLPNKWSSGSTASMTQTIRKTSPTAFASVARQVTVKGSAMEHREQTVIFDQKRTCTFVRFHEDRSRECRS